MNFPATHNYLLDGQEWRGVRTKSHSFTHWLDGREELFSLEQDRLQEKNLAHDPAHAGTRHALEKQLASLMALRRDALVPCSSYAAGTTRSAGWCATPTARLAIRSTHRTGRS